MHTALVSTHEDDERGPWSLSLLSNRFPALHGLRALAILSVLQVHVSVVLNRYHMLPVDKLFVRSSSVWFGMDLFFVLSGFLIGSMLLSDGAKGWRGIGRFYVRRSFRIIPLYYAVLTALWFIEKPSVPFVRVLPEYLYIAPYTRVDIGNVVMPYAWSLCVEEHFYLTVPLLVAVLNRLKTHRARIAVLSLLWLSGLFVRHALFWFWKIPWNADTMFRFIYVMTHGRYDTLVAGVLMAYVVHHFGDRLREIFAKGWARWVCYAIAAGLCWSLFPPHRAIPRSHWNLFAWGTVTSVMYALVVIPLVHAPKRALLNRVLGARPWLPIATLGYGVYLVHIPLMDQVVKLLAVGLFFARWPQWAVWWMSLLLLSLLSWSLAYVLHVLIEKPALWVRDRVAG
ncbi:MAG: acyltransferase [Myxococcales bacterium]|nr:acyltransferase [Myxococcales bacterium]